MKVSRPAQALVLIVVSLGACSSRSSLPPRGQLVVYVDTDAPVQPPFGTVVAPLDAVPLFDRLRVDGSLADGSPCNCEREFGVDSDQFREAAVSFGVRGDVAGNGTIRLRLYRAAVTDDGEPPADSSIDVTAALPAVGPDGIVEVTVTMSTDDVGNPVGQDVPVTPTPGRPDGSLVGTWPGATRVDCAGSPRPGEVCLPGGAFWMGDRTFEHSPAIQRADRQRLVVLSPYYLDATEVTVATYRASGLPVAAPWSGSRTGTSFVDYCNFTSAPGPYDAFPVNCVTYAQAKAYCASLGKSLPTEAQLEYATGVLGHSPYPWGTDEPSCDDVVIARSGHGAFNADPAECSDIGAPPGSALEQTGQRDHVDLAGGTLFDLSGNVYELALDVWNRQEESCWSRTGVYTDPVCTTPSKMDPGYVGVARGGGWTTNGKTARAAARGAIGDATIASGDIGLRCARGGS